MKAGSSPEEQERGKERAPRCRLPGAEPCTHCHAWGALGSVGIGFWHAVGAVSLEFSCRVKWQRHRLEVLGTLRPNGLELG